MARFHKPITAGGPYELQLSREEAVLLRSILSHVGGLGDTRERHMADGLTVAMDGSDLGDSSLDSRVFGVLVMTDRAYSELDEDEQEEYQSAHPTIERLLVKVALQLGLGGDKGVDSN